MLASRQNKWLRIITFLSLAGIIVSACTTPTAPAGTPEVVEVEREVTVEVPVDREVVVTATPGAVEAPQPTGPVTLRLSYSEGLDTPSPMTNYQGWLTYLLMFDGLFDNAGYGVEPVLAKSWEVSDDGLTWTIEVAEGMKFHDGSPFDAEEAAWAINVVRENQLGILYDTAYENVTDAVALDPTHLQVSLTAPLAEGVVRQMLATWLIPRSVWGDMTVDEMLAYNEMDAATGLGPYKLVELSPSEYEVLEAYEDSIWGDLPIDRIVMQQFSSKDALIEALLADEVDVADEVPFSAIPRLAGVENVELAVLDTTLVGFLIINSAEEGTQPASLADPTVREAMELAIDKQQIVNVAYLGYAEPLHTLIPSSMGDWHNSDLSIAFDIDAANSLLDEAGYVDSDGDGIREDLEGNPMLYRIFGVSEPVRVRIMEVIIDGLSAIGIGTEPTSMGWDGVLGASAAYDFDLMVLSSNWSPDPGFALSTFTCAQKGVGFNFSGYCDEEYEDLFRRQAQALDPEERRQIIWQMQQKVFEDKPYIMTILNKRVDAYRSDHFTGFGRNCGYILWDACLLQAQPVFGGN